jgi:hypothetical protein
MNRRTFFKASLATIGTALVGKTLVSEPTEMSSDQSKYRRHARLVFQTHDSTYHLTVLQGDKIVAGAIYASNDGRITMHRKKLMVAHEQTVYAFALDQYVEVGSRMRGVPKLS